MCSCTLPSVLRFASLVLVVLVLPVAAAGQVQGGEVGLSLGPALMGAPSITSPHAGAGVQGGVQVGWSPWWSVGAVGLLSRTAGRLDEGRAAGPRWSMFAGPSLNVDVLVVIPSIALMAGVVDAPQPGDTTRAPRAALRGSLGADWRPRRTWALGAHLEWHAWLQDPLRYPTATVVWIRWTRFLSRRTL
jgi:hypothetical protein